jgi:putative membrane protein
LHIHSIKYPKMQNPTLLRATFNPVVRTYLLLYVGLTLIFTVIGIPFGIIWFCGIGQWWSRHYFAKLECELTERTLHFKQGIFVQIEKTIPLDTIQDLTFVEGPILRYFNLCILKIETAGKGESGMSGFGNEMSLIGIVEAQNFRQAVLNQRQTLMDMRNGSTANSDADSSILIEIRDLLVKINEKIKV